MSSPPHGARHTLGTYPARGINLGPRASKLSALLEPACLIHCGRHNSPQERRCRGDTLPPVHVQPRKDAGNKGQYPRRRCCGGATRYPLPSRLNDVFGEDRGALQAGLGWAGLCTAVRHARRAAFAMRVSADALAPPDSALCAARRPHRGSTRGRADTGRPGRDLPWLREQGFRCRGHRRFQAA